MIRQEPPIGSLHDYYIQRARWIAERQTQPDELPDAEQWSKQRGKVYQQFMASLGLDPLPPRCELGTREMGSFSGEGYTARKLGYQILPDCWGSAHFYRPADLSPDQPAPAVIYCCGHHRAGVIGYQEHAIAWARRGYCCLIFDTIEQHDNLGDHHAVNMGQGPEWIGRGYSGAGGELFNGIRALDLLLTQKGVDPYRIGATGNSGGGSQSFLLTVADDRIKAVASACGVSTPDFAIPNRHVMSHCDCMYIRNFFTLDPSHYAALIAPRALLYCFARHDGLYTSTEFRTLYERTKARFEKLGHGELCELCEYDGPHGYNHPETFDTIHHFFDKHVAGESRPDVNTLAIAANGETLDEPTLSVFQGRTPEPDYTDLLPRLMAPAGRISLPKDEAEFRSIKADVIKQLRQDVFHLLDDVQQPQQLEQYGHWDQKVTWRDAWHGLLDGMTNHIMQIAPKQDESDSAIIAMSDRELNALQVTGGLYAMLGGRAMPTLGIEPRGAGFRAFREEYRTQLNREGCLTGLTPTMLMVQDLHHLWPHLKALPAVKDRKLYLYGKGESAVAMLFFALLAEDENIAAVILEDLPASLTRTHWQIMGALRILDLPGVVSLLAPLPVGLVNSGAGARELYFTQRLRDRLDLPPIVGSYGFADAFAHIVPIVEKS